jgi:uncharacterized protein YodC (DUF2158 family)
MRSASAGEVEDAHPINIGAWKYQETGACSGTMRRARWNRFQCGDRVRVLEGRDEMKVIIALGDQVHCEWFVGTELQQRAFSASLLRRMDGLSR